MTETEKDFHQQIKFRGCIVCRDPVDIHHILGRKHQWAVIGLCPAHHRPESHRLSIHKSKRTFGSYHGDEWTLYFQQLKELLPANFPEELDQSIKTYINSGHAPHAMIKAYAKSVDKGGQHG